MSNPNDFICPACRGGLEVWAEADISVKYDVKSNGRLSKKKIENTGQSDARCGVECKNCDWSAHGDDVEAEPFIDIIDGVLEKTLAMEFSEKRVANNHG